MFKDGKETETKAEVNEDVNKIIIEKTIDIKTKRIFFVLKKIFIIFILLIINISRYIVILQ